MKVLFARKRSRNGSCRLNRVMNEMPVRIMITGNSNWSVAGKRKVKMRCSKRKAAKNVMVIVQNQLVTSAGVLTKNAFSFLNVLKSLAAKSRMVWGDCTKLKLASFCNFSIPCERPNSYPGCNGIIS